ncbi:MAG: tetratricopeptide repeat protein [Candidatus Cloacimonetes bacterium]|nr:tetratricopeptide repeat protein [Candidatus Cloacimonadota bacterium]
MHSSEKHKLAAIVFTDLVGFTKIMGRDEQEGLELLKKQRELFFPIVESYSGTVLKELGDGLLIMFESSIQAVRASLQTQEVAKDNNINLRIGIHIGDVVIKDKDIIGSGVNVASRIEPLAPTGSICISEDVWHQIRNQEGLYAVSLGKQKLKNVKELIEIFKLVPDEVTLKAERISFLQSLWQRRVPQILVLYLGACWVIVEIVSSLLVDRYLLSPHLIDFSIVTLLSLIPSILLLSYFHGKPGRNEWTKVEKFGIPINLVTSLFILFLIFQGKDLGAITKTVTIENEEGETIERVIPKSEFRKSIVVFPFENESADSTLNWLQCAFSDLLDYDLSQDIYINIGKRNLYVYDMIEAGFDKGVGAPITLKKKIANDKHLNYFVSGSFKKSDDEYQIKISLYKAVNAKLISEKEYTNSDIFKLIDDISLQLKYDMKIPESHIEEVTDLQISELMTRSTNALKLYILGRNSVTFDNDWEQSQKYLEQSIEEDSTFAFSYYRLMYLYHFTNQYQKDKMNFQYLMKHLYKFTERDKFKIKGNYCVLNIEPEKRHNILVMWTKLYPDDLEAHLYLADYYLVTYQLNYAINEYLTILELDPESYQLLVNIGDLYLKVGDFEEALTYYDRYAKQLPGSYLSYEKKADLYFLIGDYQNAILFYDKALIIIPEDVYIQKRFIDIERYKGNFKSAYNLYLDLLDECISPREIVRVQSSLAGYYLLKGEINNYHKCIEIIFSEKEKYIPPLQIAYQKILRIRFNGYVEGNKTNQAFEILNNLKQRFEPPFDDFIDFGYLRIYIALEDIENIKKTLNRFNNYVQETHQYAWNYNVTMGKAYVHELKAEYNEAIVLYESCAHISPLYFMTDYNYRIGRCYRKMKEYKKSEEHLKQALTIFQFDPKTNYELAFLYQDMGKKEKALEHLNITLEVWKDADPEYIPAQEAREKLKEWEAES